MRMMRLVPAGSTHDRGGRAGRRRRQWWIGLSVLLHGMALIAALLLTRRPEPGESAAPSYELVFQGETAPQSEPSSDAATTPPSDAPADSPPAGPPAAAAPTEPMPAGPLTPSPTAPPAPSPPQQQQEAPAEPVPAQPLAPAAAPPAAEAPQAATAPEVRLDLPPSPPPPPPVPDFVMPTPPAPAPLPAAPPRPAPPRPRTAPPPGSFSNPMDLSFNQVPQRGERQAAPRRGAPPGSVASRSMDLSVGTPKPGSSRTDAFFDARARNLGGDWMQGVQQFWLRHRYFPKQAADSGQDGSVDLELTVNRTGRVLSAQLKSHSGSQWIDMAAVGTFRGAQLPPLPEEVGDPYTVTITINYILLR